MRSKVLVGVVLMTGEGPKKFVFNQVSLKWTREEGIRGEVCFPQMDVIWTREVLEGWKSEEDALGCYKWGLRLQSFLLLNTDHILFSHKRGVAYK